VRGIIFCGVCLAVVSSLADTALWATRGEPRLNFPKAVSLPFIANSDEMVIVAATAGGDTPLHVILDTGAGLDILAPSLIEKLHGKPAGQFTGQRMTGERIDVPLFTISELAIGPIVKKDAVVGSFDALDKMHLDGIIAVNDFREQAVTFDFINRDFVFETAKTLARRRADGKSASIQFDDQRGISLDVFAKFLIGNQAGQCEIDTGSQNATVSLRYMAPLGIEKDGKDVRKHESTTIAGAPEIRYNTRLPEISLAAAPEISVKDASTSFSDIIYDCNIGSEFWKGRALTIDIAHRELTVSSSPSAN
jgi:hypothetical protein